MTPDLLRQGAALVRALVEGDETARGPLSDWIEEHGLPNLVTPFPRQHIARVIVLLRGNWPVYKVDVHDDRRAGKVYSPRIGYDGDWYRLGAWPADAWGEPLATPRV